MACGAGCRAVSGLEAADQSFVFAFGCVDTSRVAETTRAEPFDQVHRFSEIPPQILYVPFKCRKRLLGGRSIWGCGWSLGQWSPRYGGSIP